MNFVYSSLAYSTQVEKSHKVSKQTHLQSDREFADISSLVMSGKAVAAKPLSVYWIWKKCILFLVYSTFYL